MVPESIAYAFGWVSWSSIFAGGVSAIAVSILMAVLGVALGFTVIHPKSDEPMSGLGTAFGIWSFISVVVSMAVGGFMAGLFAGQRGMEYGFLVWAVVLIAAMFFSSLAVGSAVKSIGVAVKGMGSGAAGLASTMGKSAAHAASSAISELRDNIHLNVDTDKISDHVLSVLRDTGVDTLQPEYLHQQMREARSDLRNSLHQLTLKPSEAEKVIAGFLENEKKRLESLTGNIDKEAAVNALMNQRHIEREEAEGLVDDAIRAYDHALQKAKESLSEAKTQVEDTKEYLKSLAVQAREKADRWASTAAKAALAAAIALIVAGLISIGAGAWGAKTTAHWHAAHHTYIVR